MLKPKPNDCVPTFVALKRLQNFNHEVTLITLYIEIEKNNKINICYIQNLEVEMVTEVIEEEPDQVNLEDSSGSEPITRNADFIAFSKIFIVLQWVF